MNNFYERHSPSRGWEPRAVHLLRNSKAGGRLRPYFYYGLTPTAIEPLGRLPPSTLHAALTHLHGTRKDRRKTRILYVQILLTHRTVSPRCKVAWIETSASAKLTWAGHLKKKKNPTTNNSLKNSNNSSLRKEEIWRKKSTGPIPTADGS